MLEEPYLDAGLDKFLWMLPARYLDRPLWDEVLGLAAQAGPAGHTLVSGMHHAIAALSQAGNNVIADHVLVEPSWLQECAVLLSDLPAYFIGVRCPLEIVIEREKARQNRTLGQAELQYDLVHRPGIYDLEVDTALHSAEECALQIKLRLDSGNPPTAFKQLRHDHFASKAHGNSQR